jgi:hypothetical protein
METRCGFRMNDVRVFMIAVMLQTQEKTSSDEEEKSLCSDFETIVIYSPTFVIC